MLYTCYVHVQLFVLHAVGVPAEVFGNHDHLAVCPTECVISNWMLEVCFFEAVGGQHFLQVFLCSIFWVHHPVARQRHNNVRDLESTVIDVLRRDNVNLDLLLVIRVEHCFVGIRSVVAVGKNKVAHSNHRPAKRARDTRSIYLTPYKTYEEMIQVKA